MLCLLVNRLLLQGTPPPVKEGAFQQSSQVLRRGVCVCVCMMRLEGADVSGVEGG